MLKNEYIALRNKYTPERIKAIFVLESPPATGRYFYNPNGKITEPLFKAMMELVGCKMSDKATGLAEFVKRGFVIVDASYKPVNHKNKKERNRIIMDSYPTLLNDLATLTPDKKMPIILVKSNVCKLLADPLELSGFKVINNGVDVYFPSSGQQRKFREQIARVLINAKLI